MKDPYLYPFVALDGSEHPTMDGVRQANRIFWNRMIIPTREENKILDHIKVSEEQNPRIDTNYMQYYFEQVIKYLELNTVSFNDWIEYINTFLASNNKFEFPQNFQRKYLLALYMAKVLCMTPAETESYNKISSRLVLQFNEEASKGVRKG